MPVYGLQQGRRRSLIRNASNTNWTDCIVWRRNAAGNGWNRVHSGLVILQPTGSGYYSINVLEPAPGTRNVSYGGAGIQAIEGYGPFTYSWTRVGGSAQMQATNTHLPTPIFSASVTKNTEVTSTWRVSVYDAMTGRTVTYDRSISLGYYSNI